MAAVSNSLVVTSTPQLRSTSGYSLKPLDRELAGFRPLSSSNNHPQGKVKLSTTKRAVVVQASYSDGGRTGTAGAFVGGFVLGGLVVGALGCVFAPQISKALADVDRKDLMRKLPKFIYDEEKALEKTRKILTEKIAQLNSAIDDVSSQLRTDHHVPNGGVVKSDEVEAGI